MGSVHVRYDGRFGEACSDHMAMGLNQELTPGLKNTNTGRYLNQIGIAHSKDCEALTITVRQLKPLNPYPRNEKPFQSFRYWEISSFESKTIRVSTSN